MTSILYYISGHGFGHMVRSAQVIRALKKARPDLVIYVRSTAPEWLIQNPLFSVNYSHQCLDVGMVQRDSLEMEVGETLRACRALHAEAPKLVRQGTDFIRHHHIRLVLGDIPPLCFEIAAQAAVPSVAVTNFVWSWIYRAYLNDYPDFLPLIEEMDGFYGKATLALALPYTCDMEIFPSREAIPWIARTSALSKEEARNRLGLPRLATIVLVSFGGIGLSRLPWSQLQRAKDFVFVATGAAENREGNVWVLPEAQPRYEDVVRAADVIVTKPGYGIVADLIAHRVPALYTARGDFPEYARLVQALSECATAGFIPQEDLLSGDFASYLMSLLERKPNWPDVPLDGATVAAERILTTLDRYS